MSFLSIEIKARCHSSAKIRAILENNNATFHGIDHQIDTYFNVSNGRLKLREGNIENFLIHYERPDQAGPKSSEVSLYRSNPERNLKTVLSKALGIKVIVDKKRAIYFIENVKFHLDEVQGLGSFVEIEAQNKTTPFTVTQLQEQCEYYLQLFGIHEKDLITHSYSDFKNVDLK
ncbi:MAG: class IV adenylate cyclase [Saprospiraceae bacterium]